MALSNKLSAFDIDAILASTADQTPHTVVLVKQFVNHKRGLKAYADRYERVHGKELLQTYMYICIYLLFMAFVIMMKVYYLDVYILNL